MIKEVTGKIKSFDQTFPRKITINDTEIFQNEKLQMNLTTTLPMSDRIWLQKSQTVRNILAIM